ncbi:MAG: shikimate kinase [Clostridia bacterium]|nr:shikimate kinase [Clostridia bacterium]
MKKRIVLIGFAGCGKTVVGRTAAVILDWDFADTDALIEEVTGQPPAKLLKKFGEVRFRSEEKLIMNKLASRENLVIATGGNLDLKNNNLQLLKNDESFFVLLEADAETLIERLSRKNNRPNWTGKINSKDLSAQLAERSEQYKQMADFKLNTSGLTIDEAAEIICREVKKE